MRMSPFSGGFEVSFPGKPGNEKRTDLVGAVQIQNPFLVEQNPRKKVMGEVLDFGTAVEYGERAIGKDPGVWNCWLF
jgi:hypothetical protein